MKFEPKYLSAGVAVLCILAGAGRAAPARDSSAGRLRVQRTDGTVRLLLDEERTLRATTASIVQEQLISIPGSRTLLALWREEWGGTSHPYYSIVLDSRRSSPPRRTSYELTLRHGAFDPVVHVPPVALPLRAGADCELYLVQFVTQPIEEFRAAVGALGGTVCNYLAHHAHIVRMDGQVREQVRQLPFVRWVGPYHPAYRLEEFLRQEVELGHVPPTGRYNIQVVEPGAANKAAVADRIAAIGGTIVGFSAEGIVLGVVITGEQLLTAATWPEVLFIDRWLPPEDDMNIVREVGGADHIEALAGYDGAGVRGEVVDGNVLETHVDFASRPLILHGPKSGDPDHGTSTTGVIFGDGTGSAVARGLLPAGQGIFADYTSLSNRYAHTAELLNPPYYAVFQSNSWGSGLTTSYTSTSADMDEIIFDLDILICQSQSNTGSQLSRPEAWAKNIVSVGGIVHQNTVTKADDGWFGDASIGPAADGRIKPDLSYFNDLIYCPEGDGGYDDFGGTSAATPEVAGHFGLFFQLWADGIFSNPVSGGTVFEERPHAATAKAAIINSASAYPFSGTGHDLTRTHQGWGLPDVRRLYDLRNNVFIVDETDVLQEFQSREYARAFSPGVPNHDELRITLAYLDLPGTTSSSQHRINDLTLKVTSPSLVAYWGNNGLHAGNWSTSGGSPNTKDNVENVFIRNPEGGTWTIEVSADDVNGDGHVESPQWDVDYALVISGGDSCLFSQFLMQPQSTFTCYGEEVTLEAAVTGHTSLQWYKDGSPLAGEIGMSLTIADFGPADEGEYWLVATNECGDLPSETATVLYAGTPVITVQPEPPLTPRCEGDDVFLTLEAGGVGPFTYQWYHEGTAIEGAAAASLLISPAEVADAGEYYCVVSNECESVTSNTVVVDVRPLPVFIVQPQDACGELGETILLAAEATASGPLMLQWRKGDTVVGTGETLTLEDLDPSDAGDYHVVAFTLNPVCVAVSDTATVTVGDCLSCTTPGDMDGDGDFDLSDVQQFVLCFGTSIVLDPGCTCANLDDSDTDVNLADWSQLAPLVSGSGPL